MSTMSRALRSSTMAVTLLLAALLAACSGSGSPTSPPDEPDGASAQENDPATAEVADPDAGQSSKAERIWSRRLAVIGQPVTAGRAVLVLVRTGSDGVEMVSLDGSSGKENFRVSFNPGGSPSGVEMTPKVTRMESGRYLAVVRRYEVGAPGPALVALDVQTGRIVRSTPRVIDDYDACSDGSDVCWSGYASSSDGFVFAQGEGPMRWDLETGRVVEKEGEIGARQIGDDLYVGGEGSASTVSRLKGSRRTVWSQRTSVAVAPGADPNFGWSFDYDTKEDVYVGSLGRPFSPVLLRAFRRGERVELDYRKHYLTVGIDGQTGEQLWSRRGANPWCPLLRSIDDIAARTLCVVSGSRVQQEGRESRDKDLAITIEGVDPTSGEAAWTFELAGKGALKAYGDEVAPLAPYGRVLPSSDGPVALDMRTGERQTVADDTVLLCPAGPDQVTAYGRSRTAGDLYRSCDATGRPVNDVPSTFGVAGVDGEGDVRFVSMPGRLVAFRL